MSCQDRYELSHTIRYEHCFLFFRRIEVDIQRPKRSCIILSIMNSLNQITKHVLSHNFIAKAHISKALEESISHRPNNLYCQTFKLNIKRGSHKCLRRWYMSDHMNRRVLAHPLKLVIWQVAIFFNSLVLRKLVFFRQWSVA
jgi:hypothetical protein